MNPNSRKFSTFYKCLDSFSLKDVVYFVGISAVYFFAGKLELRIAFANPFVRPIWLPSGITVASFLLFGSRVWPAVVVGSLLSAIGSSGAISASVISVAGATLGGFLGAYFIQRFGGGRKSFDTARGVFVFVFFGCICPALIDSTSGVTAMYLGRHVNVADCELIWLRWWLANGIGILLLTPFLVLLFKNDHHRFDLRDVGELTAMILGLVCICLMVFGPLSISINRHQLVRPWLIIPFLIWAGFRFCPLEASGATLIVFSAAIWGTSHGYGTFVAGSPAHSLILLDGFIGVIGTMTLVVAALVVEQRNFKEELLGTHAILREAVDGKDRDLIVTVRALEMEVAGHARTQKTLRETEERLRSAVPAGKSRTEIRRETYE